MTHRLLLLAAAAALTASPAQAQRAETSIPARLVVRPDCVIAPADATDAERLKMATESALGVALATVAAKAAGALVTSGANALGEALEAASREQAYVAEGAGSFNFYELQPPERDVRPLARLAQKRACLVLHVPGSDAAPLAGLGSQTALTGRTPPAGAQRLRTDAAAIEALADIGLAALPALYVEAELVPAKDGVAVRPVLVWYRQALKNAPGKPDAVELHVSLATPAAGPETQDIGAVFATAQIKLPKMVAPQVLAPWDLKGVGFVAAPARPTTGSPDAKLTALNGLHARVATLTAEEKAAMRAAEAAQRKLQAKASPENREADIVARRLLEDKRSELQAASARAWMAEAEDLGTTNVKMRLALVRDANKFGLAIAKGLKGAADDAGTAVKDALTPAPAWAPTDTAYLEAINNINAKQREHDAAVAGGDAAAVARTADELIILKARANEAAVAAKRDLPYPSLL